MNALKDLKLDDVLEELRGQARRRIDDVLSEGRKQGRKQARHIGGGPGDGALFSVFTFGMLAGLLAGAAIALLVTPLSGRQARAKLSERVERMRSDVPVWSGGPNGNGAAAGSYEPTRTAPLPV